MKTVVLFSGGLDSTVLLVDLHRGGDDVLALTVNYGQRHGVEISHARQMAGELSVEWQCAELSSIAPLLAGSSQTSADIAVPHGHYTDESMKQTVVPNRNMIMLAVAGGWAISRRADRLAYAAHDGDHAIYPDCRPAFVTALGAALGLADWHQLQLHCPYLSLRKADIVSRGAALGVDFSKTWSCYEGQEVHCGRCGTCVERQEAFGIAGISDPTPYRAVTPSSAARRTT